jgi:hypothetical protein
MRLLKAISSVCVVVLLASALGGCVVVPVPYGPGYYHHYYRR